MSDVGSRRVRAIAAWAVVLLMAAVLVGVGPGPHAAALNFDVGATSDGTDSNPGDGVCDTGVATCTLRAAIMEANATPAVDVIDIGAGTFVLDIVGANEEGAATGDLDITAEVIIQGVHASQTIIDASALGDRVFHIHPGVTVTIRDVTISGGSLDDTTDLRGGGILNQGNLVLDRVTVSNNTVDGGGSLARGGGIFNEGTLDLGTSTVEFNSVTTTTAEAQGGGVFDAMGMTAGAARISDNQATSGTMPAAGGGVYVDAGITTTLDGTIVRDNLARAGITSQTGETGARGGGIFVAGTLDLTNGVIDGNTAFGSWAFAARSRGGGIAVTGSATISQTEFVANAAQADLGPVTAPGSAAGGGLAVVAADATVTVDRSVFHGDTDNPSAPDPNLANRAESVDSFGQVAATARGGAVYVSAGTLDLVNTTISGSVARRGAGLYRDAGTVMMRNVTVAANMASTSGGGIGGTSQGRSDPIASLLNSVVADNQAPTGPDCSSRVENLGYLFVADAANCTIEGDAVTLIVDQPSGLGPIADNGGGTFTHAVLDGSPAAGTASPDVPGSGGTACEAVDQRGTARPQGDRCDRGAYESAFTYVPPAGKSPVDFNGDGFADAAIGAPGEAIGNKAGAGNVNVIYGSASGLTATGDLTLYQSKTGVIGTSETGDAFGTALTTGDFNGDGYTDLAVGVPGEDIGSIVDAGLVQVFYGSASGITVAGDQSIHQDTANIPGKGEAGDLFGAALAATDLNRDGFSDLIVGAPGEALGSKTAAGAVTVIYGSATGLDTASAESWHQDTAGVAGGAEAGDRFGAALAAADFDGDGFGDVAVAAPGEGLSGKNDAGLVHVLFGSASGLAAAGDETWSQGTGGLGGARENGDAVGSALAAGDVNGDGFFDLVIGVPSEDLGAKADAGSISVLLGSASGLGSPSSWHQDTAGVSGTAEAGDEFGFALALGDADGDGFDEVAVGVPGEALSGATGAGFVNVLAGSAGGVTAAGNQTWSQGSSLGGARESGDRFGAALAWADHDGDGFGDLLVGVPGEALGSKAAAGMISRIPGSAGGLTSTGSQTVHQDTAGIGGTAEAGDGFGAALG